MTTTGWSLADKLSRLLESDERDAVLGDLAESNATGGKAFRDVLGLVFRRQAALWKDWRPWVALVGLVGPVGLQLSQMSLVLSFPLYMHLRTYLKYGVRYGNGLTALEETVMLLCHGLALLVWCWTSGFVLGSLSRRTIWITGTLYFLVWVYPLLLMAYLFVRAYPHPQPQLPLAWLMPILQAVLWTILLLLSQWGVRQGLRNGALTLSQTRVLTVVILALMVLATWTGGWPGAALIRLSSGEWDASAGWQGRLFRYAVMSWPVGYLLAMAISRRQTKTVHP